KVANGSLLSQDFAAGQLQAGPRGPMGDTGAQGPPGQNGSPDTAQQVLDKVKTVDGSGSGLDADTVGGVPPSGFAPAQAESWHEVSAFGGAEPAFRSANQSIASY